MNANYTVGKNFAPRGLKIVFITVAVIGFIFAAVGGIGLTVLFGEKGRCTFETEGVVAELVKKVSTSNKGRERISYAPVYSYEFDGKIYNYQSKIGSSPPPFSVGQRVKIMVNPDNPSEIYVPESNIEWILAWVFAGLGLLFIALSVVLIVLLRKKARGPLTIEDEIREYESGKYRNDPDDLFR